MLCRAATGIPREDGPSVPGDPLTGQSSGANFNSAESQRPARRPKATATPAGPERTDTAPASPTRRHRAPPATPAVARTEQRGPAR